MSTRERNAYLRQEGDRLIRLQHQHRGLTFSKLWLPPSTDRNVNIIGCNNRIYQGQIPTVPVDEFPPDVDPETIDEEKLYEEIRNMKFPKIPPQKPLGPARSVGGEYTKAKRLIFAPVIIETDERRVETSIVRADGKVDKGTKKPVLVPKLKGKKRKIRRATPPKREPIAPPIVCLQVDGKTPSEIKAHLPLIELPIYQLNKMIELVRKRNSESPRQERSPEVD